MPPRVYQYCPPVVDKVAPRTDGNGGQPAIVAGSPASSAIVSMKLGFVDENAGPG